MRWGQLDEHKADVKGANALLIKELYGALGDSMLTGNPRLPVLLPPAHHASTCSLLVCAPHACASAPAALAVVRS